MWLANSERDLSRARVICLPLAVGIIAIILQSARANRHFLLFFQYFIASRRNDCILYSFDTIAIILRSIYEVCWKTHWLCKDMNSKYPSYSIALLSMINLYIVHSIACNRFALCEKYTLPFSTAECDQVLIGSLQRIQIASICATPSHSAIRAHIFSVTLIIQDASERQASGNRWWKEENKCSKNETEIVPCITAVWTL